VSTANYFQRGLGLKAEVQDDLVRDYQSAFVSRLKAAGRVLRAGDLTLRLAAEFGFCYGVDRAIEYAYETRRKFPGRRTFLVGEIIHNPGVNARLREMGVEFLPAGADGEDGLARVTADDVVIIPAFGVTTAQMDHLRATGCVLVDTTCGSVLNVWKRVERYAREGFTSIIHGKHYHEETRATASRALAHEGGHYVVVRNLEEAEVVCDWLRGRGDRAAFLARFSAACSPGFDPDRHLHRVGVANQTTMLSSESLAIAARLREVMVEAHGEPHAAASFRSFDTICSATQDRQDAVVQLLDEGVDVIVVIGGYNSSNTANLARLCAERVPTYHVATSDCIAADGSIRYLPAATRDEVVAPRWLPPGAARVGITAGASTPDGEIGAVMLRLLGLRGMTLGDTDLPADVAPGPGRQVDA
jgi:4-hydroxy-3-methylbut-2-enyl diphosphate reductase